MGNISAEEQIPLAQLQQFASHSSHSSDGADSKERTLVQWLNLHVRPQGQWGQERVIIFTEYRATQKWLYELLAHEGFARNERLAMIYGGMDNEQREKIKAAFQAHPDQSGVRILLATDAASEGVNLQNHCNKLVHMEIPWNPNRMEQRNGRIDRHGQKAATVEIFHFVGSGFDQANVTGKVGELEADLEFLMRAALKVETIREDLGKVGPVIASQVEEAMLGRRQHLDTRRAEQDAEPVRALLKLDRKLREQLEKLAQQLDDTRNELDMTPEAIENVVRVGLALAQQPPLIPVSLPGIWPDPQGVRTRSPVFQLAPMQLSWAHCTDGLAHPHTKQPRPIVFDPALSNGRDDVVLAHLNHRLVQMCLRLLRAEIWATSAQDDSTRHLSRVCACTVDDAALAHPVVLAHARIVVLGGDNQRLHEEIICAGGEIQHGRFRRLNVGETRHALQAMNQVDIAEELQATLQKLWYKLQEPLHAALDARQIERTKNLEKTFTELAEKEVNKLTSILQDLQRAIHAELAREVDPQLRLDLGDDEPGQQQRERDLEALQQRHDAIPAEIAREAANLRQRFANPSARLFPVAVTWLIPRKAVAAIIGGRA